MADKYSEPKNEVTDMNEMHITCEFQKICKLSKQRRLHRNKVQSRKLRQSSQRRRR